MLFHFSKIQALGNDFVVVDGRQNITTLDHTLIANLCDRRLGIGCDQLLMVKPIGDYADNIHFEYRIFNADGSEVIQCGNGARAAALFLQRQGIQHSTIYLHTLKHQIRVDHLGDDIFRAELTKPEFEPHLIPMLATTQANDYVLTCGDMQWTAAVMNLGNPHCVIRVENLDQIPVVIWGEQISNHPLFPEKINVEFCQVINCQTIRMRVYERGVGETPACGSGACAAMVACSLWGLVDEQTNVQMPGGEVSVSWPALQAAVLLEGPAAHVFDGVLEI